MPIDIHTLAERPDLRDATWDLSHLWPAFMRSDPLADLYFARLETYADHVLVARDGERTVGRAYAVPLALGAEHDRPRLPHDGWDAVVRWSWLDHLAGRAPTHVSALEITVLPELRGSGLAGRLLDAMRAGAEGIGAAALVAPVRPSRKHLEPTTPTPAYAARCRDDGLPEDPWLRLHVRSGGRIEAVCPRSMVIPGTLAEWRDWTGLAFDRSGPVEVAGALVPVHVDVDQDHAVYVEPNVWVVHDLGGRP